MASSEAEDAAVATTNGISLAPGNLEEEVAHLMSQELPYSVFDTDVAVASILNTKLEFDEALLAENVNAKAEVESGAQKDNQEKDSGDEDSSHYVKFTRMVVSNATGSTDTSSQLPPAPSISQLDGADSETESEEETKAPSFCKTPTKRLTVNLTRLEPTYTLTSNTKHPVTEPNCRETLPSPVFLESGCINNDLSLQEEEVPTISDTSTSPNEMLLDSETGHFVSAAASSIVTSKRIEVLKLDESSSSSDASLGYKDDLRDTDFHPGAEQPTIKTILVKKRPCTPNPKPLIPKQNLLQPPKVNVFAPRPPQTIGIVPQPRATFCTVPRPVSSPIIINGLNTLPAQSVQGRNIAIRLDGSKPLVVPNQAVATGLTAPQTPPVRQVLLVNRQGQILVKDPRTNTFQTLSANSPTYTKISQIAKILHSGTALSQSVPRVVTKPQPSPSNANNLPASNHAPTEKKIIVRVLPVKKPLAPVTVESLPRPRLRPNVDQSPAQTIIDKAMATHRDALRPKPIILSKTRRLSSRHQRLSPDTDESGQSSMERSKPPNAPCREPRRHQVRVKRVSSVSERPSKKKSKTDFLIDLSNEPKKVQQSRYLISLHHKKQLLTSEVTAFYLEYSNYK